ncbi:unnamed protein product [Rhizoctonia solani]|uniref:Uncharacterized protein n=1 Tax=Rhizoctonia solani TaxID=456999 RepID=A0A8H3H118_9AGAM|nr:unnamed protein product [Rhizoctonia solani]
MEHGPSELSNCSSLATPGPDQQPNVAPHQIGAEDTDTHKPNTEAGDTGIDEGDLVNLTNINNTTSTNTSLPHKNTRITVDLAKPALARIEAILKSSGGGRGGSSSAKAQALDAPVLRQIHAMAAALRLFCHSNYTWDFTFSTDTGAIASGYGASYGRTIRRLIRTFIESGDLPKNRYGNATGSIIDDEDFAYELKMHLWSVGKYAKAQDIITYVDTDEVKARFDLAGPPCLRTAQRWMKKLGYSWGKELKGQYVDGHERKDVVDYRNNYYIPEFTKLARRMTTYDSVTMEATPPVLEPGEQPVMMFKHDETVVYAHDQRDIRWIGDDETPQPMPKGEGLSLMYAGYISTDGWLRSDDPDENPEVILRPGKNRDGFMDGPRTRTQIVKGIGMAKKKYPKHKIVFIYDNATTHTSRRPDAPSATKMTLNPSKNFGVTIIDENKKKHKIRMGDAKFADGTPQPLYYPPDHPDNPDEFKGIAQILHSVPLVSIRRFWNRALRFVDAYRQGLDGAWAAWAAKKYRGHRVLPQDILKEVEAEILRQQGEGSQTHK